VQVFFALSGWLIGGILINTESKDLTRFYFNRAIRIWVPYYLACGLLLGLSMLREPVTAKWLEIVAYKLSFVYNLFGTPQLAEFHDAMPEKGTLSHVWSVNAEEQFYLVAPLLLVIGARWAGRSIVLWSVIAALVYTTSSGAIALGVLSALVGDRFGPFHRGKQARLALGLTLIVSLGAMMSGGNQVFAAPLAAVCIVLLLAVPGQRHPAGELLGGMSYPLYLNHWIGLFAATYASRHLPLLAEPSGVWRALLQAAINLPLAMALFWWVDRRLLARRTTWFTPHLGRVVTLVAYSMITVGVLFGFAMAFRR
jgi:peptidoglycan/LPS O-acetylase OafA/YrhL